MTNKERLAFLFLILILSISYGTMAQDTFSIVAVDSTTGEVGSAGASCLDDRSFPGSGGAYIISDIVPGKGAVHTQSFYIQANQANANRMLLEGKTASEISDWLQRNDAQNNARVRQYGMVTLDENGMIEAAAFTGSNCFDEKGHLVGNTYAIQGNILIDQYVLDSMEARFLKTKGDLCVRLMAALQGANIPGADSRCLSEGVSSQSAFIRVARKTDDVDEIWMDLNIPFTDFGVEPIDELQKKFDAFKKTQSTSTLEDLGISITPNPTDEQMRVFWENYNGGEWTIRIFNEAGMSVFEKTVNDAELKINVSSWPGGIYPIQVVEEGQSIILNHKIVIR